LHNEQETNRNVDPVRHPWSYVGPSQKPSDNANEEQSPLDAEVVILVTPLHALSLIDQPDEMSLFWLTFLLRADRVN